MMINPFKLFLGALWVLGARRRALGRAIAPALVAHGGFALWTSQAPEAATAALPGALLLALALHVLVSVNILRLVLVGSDAVPPLGLAPWSRRQWRFLAALGLQALVMTFAMLAFAPLAFLGTPGLLICAAAGIFAAGRASLVLPAAALDLPFDGRSLWARGQGASLALAVLVLAPVLCQALLLGPFSADGGFVAALGLTVLAQLASAWTTATLAFAWSELGRRGVHAEDAVAMPSLPLTISADRATGLLTVTVTDALSTEALGRAAAGDPLIREHGHLSALLLQLEGEAWACASEKSADALDTLLSHLGVLRVHQTGLRRVALLGDAAWAARRGVLEKHFPGSELRFAVPEDCDALRVWLGQAKTLSDVP